MIWTSSPGGGGGGGGEGEEEVVGEGEGRERERGGRGGGGGEGVGAKKVERESRRGSMCMCCVWSCGKRKSGHEMGSERASVRLHWDSL